MIEDLVNLFDTAVTAPVATRHGLAIRGEDGPMRHSGGGQYTLISADNEAPWSYWIAGNIQSTPADIFTCEVGALHRIPFRLVMLLPNECGVQGVLLEAANAVARSMGSAKDLLGAIRVKVVASKTYTDGVASVEKIGPVPLQWSLVAVDIDVEVLGTADCLVGCGDSASLLCTVIDGATNGEVVECLGEARVAEICDAPVVPCAPFTVLRDGLPYDVVNDPCGGEIDVICDGGPCDPLKYTLINTNDDTLDSGSVTDPCGGELNLVAPDATVRTSLNDRDVMDIPSGNAMPLPKTVIDYTDENGDPQEAGAYETEFLSGLLRPLITVPRREILYSDSSGTGVWATVQRLIDNTIPQVPGLCSLLNSVNNAVVKTSVYDCMNSAAQFAISVVPGLDKDALAYIARVEQADDDNLEWEVRECIFDYVAALKAASLWTAITAHVPMIGARTVAGALVPLKGRAPINYGFVTADYNRETGLIGNATTKYLDSMVANNVNGQNNQSMGVWVNTIPTGTAAQILMGAGVSGTGTNNIVRRVTPNNGMYSSRNRNSSFDTPASNALVAGYVGTSRSAGTGYSFRSDGTDTAVTRASETPSTENIYVFGTNNAGAVSVPTDARLSMYCIGAAITQSALDTAFGNYKTAIAAAIP